MAGLDKVVKSYVATEFLHDYLKDRKTVCGVDEARRRPGRLGMSCPAEQTCPSMRTKPRMPLMHEIAELWRRLARPLRARARCGCARR